MKCPNCNSELVKKQYEDTVAVDSCETCHGMWLDAGELERIQELKVNDHYRKLEGIPDIVGNAIDLAKAKNKPSVDCPVCNTELDRREYGYTSQILIDTCVNAHGIWLDKYEIEALEVFYVRRKEAIRKDDIKSEEEANSSFLASLFYLLK